MKDIFESLEEARDVVVSVKELPKPLQKALKAIGYKKRDISVEPKDKAFLQHLAGEGYRSITAVVNLATGKYEIHKGAWGGPSPYDPRGVDMDQKLHAIPPNGAVIVATEGGNHPVHGWIYVHPQSIAPILPGGADTTERQRSILKLWGYISSYRKEEMRHMKVTDKEIDELVKMGMLKKNKRGATSITTKGKNEMRKTS